MTIQEYMDNIGKLEESLKREVPQVLVTKVAQDLKVMITQRVIETGKNSNGSKFSGYSTTPTYINTTDNSPKRLESKGKTGRTVFAKTGKPHKSTYFGGGYNEFRDRIGRSTEKDFFLTGEMWRMFGVKRVEDNGEAITVTLGGTTPASQDKIDGNSKREGMSILEPTKDEVRVIERNFQKWLDNLAEGMLT